MEPASKTGIWSHGASLFCRTVQLRKFSSPLQLPIPSFAVSAPDSHLHSLLLLQHHCSEGLRTLDNRIRHQPAKESTKIEQLDAKPHQTHLETEDVCAVAMGLLQLALLFLIAVQGWMQVVPWKACELSGASSC